MAEWIEVPAHRIYVICARELRDGFDYIGENGKAVERGEISSRQVEVKMNQLQIRLQDKKRHAQVFLSSRQLRPVYTLSFKLFSRNFHRGLGAWIFLLSSLAMVGYVICRVNSKQYALPANLRRSGPPLAWPRKIVPKCSHWKWGRTLVREPGPESYGGERIGHHCRPVDHAYLAPQQYRRSAQRYDRPI